MLIIPFLDNAQLPVQVVCLWDAITRPHQTRTLSIGRYKGLPSQRPGFYKVQEMIFYSDLFRTDTANTIATATVSKKLVKKPYA
jgi:hypothetical protein